MTPSGMPASSRRAFGPISTFPPPPRDGVARAKGPAPAWVVAYLALCVMLTFAGLVALALESRFLSR